MKIFFSGIVSRASGKFTNMVFSTWRGLAYVREWVKPYFPGTPRQLAVNAIFKEISQYWANTLPEGLRIAWTNFVFRWTDLWGNSVNTTGLNLFQKFNFFLRDSGRAFQTTTPPPITPPEIIFGISQPPSESNITLEVIPGSVIISQAPFIDLWTAGIVSGYTIDDSSLLRTLIVIYTTGLPQGVNPTQSDFRHTLYINQLANGENPLISKEIRISYQHSSEEGQYLIPTRLATILRQYNKYGRYSAAIKKSVITVVP